MKLDFIHRLKEFVEGLGETPSAIDVNTIKGDGDGVAIRPTPGSIENRELSKEKSQIFSFQITVRYKSELKAYEVIEAIKSALDEDTGIVSNNNSFALTRLDCTGTPGFVTEDPRGYIYTALFEAELYLIRG